MTDVELSQRSLSFEMKAVDESSRSIDVIMSTSAIDSYNERIDQSGWMLDRFRANPVLLQFHNSREWPLGRCENVRVEAGALQCRIVFASAKANPEAEKCFQLVKERVVNAVSVGMLVRDSEMVVEGETEVHVLRKCELAELSIVTVPANPEALIKRALREKQLEESRAAAAHVPPGTGEQDTNMADDNKALIAEHEKTLADLRGAHAAEIEKHTKAIEALTSDRDALTADLNTLSKAVKEMGTERDDALDKLATSEKALAESKDRIVTFEVNELVGKKIAPAEVEEFIELRKSNPSLFDKMIAKRPEMSLLTTVVAKKDVAPPTATTKASDTVAALIEELSAEQAEASGGSAVDVNDLLS